MCFRQFVLTVRIFLLGPEQQQRPEEEGGLGGGKSFFLSTEGAFPARRLSAMANEVGLHPE
jgi:hypothetical protein